jgi:hypothetical protein
MIRLLSLPGRIKAYAAAAVAIILALVAARVAAWRNRAVRAENKALRGYVETRGATDEVDMGNDAGLVRERMRKRDPDKR